MLAKLLGRETLCCGSLSDSEHGKKIAKHDWQYDGYEWFTKTDLYKHVPEPELFRDTMNINYVCAKCGEHHTSFESARSWFTPAWELQNASL